MEAADSVCSFASPFRHISRPIMDGSSANCRPIARKVTGKLSDIYSYQLKGGRRPAARLLLILNQATSRKLVKNYPSPIRDLRRKIGTPAAMLVRKAKSLGNRDSPATEMRHMKNIFGSLPRLNNLLSSNFIRRIVFSGTLISIAFNAVTVGQNAYADRTAVGFRIEANDAEVVYSIERRVFDLVNDERIKIGSQPLIWIEPAASAARYHSATMAEGRFLGHSDLTGRKVDDRADQFGFSDWRRIGENVAWVMGHSDPAARVVECWMRSPGHRKNLLDSNYRESGLGLSVSSDGKYYFTQVFVRRK